MIKTYKLKTILALCVLYSLIGNAQDKDLFRNEDLTINERVDDLVSKLTLEEKAEQLLFRNPPIDRLNIPTYNWLSEGLHGVSRSGRATIYPQAIALAATWDTVLVNRIGDAVGTEARAKYNTYQAAGREGEQYQSLTLWSPNVNIFRDPRWGRGQETYGEDPLLTSKMGVAYVSGLQGKHPKYLKVAGMGKHYAVHSGPENLRHQFNAEVSKQDLWDTYLPAFEALVKEAKVEGIMGAYNRTNGNVCCAHPYLMDEILRKQWGFKGYFVSDCGALKDFYDGHNIVDGPKQAAALALQNGCNLNCGDTYKSILDAIDEGLLNETELDRNLKELLPTKFRLGLFDNNVPYDTIGPNYIGNPDFVDLSRKAATKAMVLLKNKDQTLPLNKDLHSVHVTGPTAAHIQSLLGNYHGHSNNLVTFLEGIVGKVSKATMVKYTNGTLLNQPISSVDGYGLWASESSEVTIAFLGISMLIEGEQGENIASKHSGDRKEIRLPENQIEFIKEIRKKAKKLIVVVTSGSAIPLPEVYDIADALVYAWYPGEQGGNALADLLFGDVVPSGRLPFTVVKDIADLPPFEDYAMDNRTYRYMEKEPQFPFGFGLSYSTFSYSDILTSKSNIKKGSDFTVTANITNHGDFQAEEVVQLYIKDIEASTRVPVHALKDFKRVELGPGETKQIMFRISPKMLELVQEDGSRTFEKGLFKIIIGGCSPSRVATQLGAAEPVSCIVEIR